MPHPTERNPDYARGRRRIGVLLGGAPTVELVDAAAPAELYYPERPDWRTLGGFLSFAQSEDFEQVWVHPSAFPGVLGAWLASGHDGWRVGDSTKAPHWRRCFRNVGAYDHRPVDLVLPELDARHPYFAAAAPLELGAALMQFEHALGMRYRWSAGKTGESLLVECHTGPRAAPLIATQLPPPARDMRVEMDREWIRPLADDEPRRAIVAYDANAAYLAATSSLKAGQGEYTHFTVTAGSDVTEFVSYPGYWFASIKYTPPPELPFPFEAGMHWITTPTLQLARQLGADVTIHEAYVWGHSRRPLESWYRRVRNARGYLREQTTAPGAEIALKALKDMYARFLGGRVASERLDRHKVAQWDRTGDMTFRPDWRHAIIATARANQFRSLLTLLECGWAPFAIITDCLYFAVDHLMVDLPGGLRVDTNPGAYKFAGMVPATNTDAAVALDNASTDRRRLNHLRDAWRSV